MIWTGELVNAGDPSHVTQTYPNRSLWGERESECARSKGAPDGGDVRLYYGNDEGTSSFIGPIEFSSISYMILPGAFMPGCGGLTLPGVLSTVECVL